MKLYELTNDYLEVLALAEEAESQVLRDTLESIESVFDDKAENIAKVVKTLDANTQAIKAEIQRLQERKSTMENNIKGIKEYLQQEMERSGKTRIKGTLFTISIQKNPPSVRVTDEKRIPEIYFIPQEPKLSKEEIKKVLKGGGEVEGAELVQTEGVRIR